MQNLYSQTGFVKLFPEINVQYPNNFSLINNGIIAIGTKDSSMYIANIDSTNQILWDKKLKCELSSTVGRKLTKSSDTTFICLGDGNEKIFIAKLTNDGDTIWTKSYSGIIKGRANDLLIDSDNNILVCGYTSFSNGYYRYGFMLKLDSKGDSIYFKNTNEVSEYNSITESSSGYLVAGSINNNESNKVFIINYNLEGDIIWTKQYGGRYSSDAYSVDKTNDNNFLIAGTIYTAGTFYTQCYILKINQNGDTIWTKTFGREYTHDIAYSLKKISDTKYIVVGTQKSVSGSSNKTSGFYSILNNDGEIVSTETYFAKPSDDVAFYSAEMVADNTYQIFGSQGNNLLLIRTKDDGGFYNDIKGIEVTIVKIYPNPTTGELKIESGGLRIDNIEIFDISGRKLLAHKSTMSLESTVDISYFSAGVYFVKISTEIGELVKKVLKE